jgi:hypothetical protein
MYAIVKYEPKRESDVNAFLWGMYLLYASRPGKRQPELDGSYFIGDVGETRLQDQRLRRETPYSICGGLRQT